MYLSLCNIFTYTNSVAAVSELPAPVNGTYGKRKKRERCMCVYVGEKERQDAHLLQEEPSCLWWKPVSQVTVNDRTEKRPVKEVWIRGGNMGNEHCIPHLGKDREMQRVYRHAIWWQGEQQISTLLRAEWCCDECNIYSLRLLFMMGKASVTHAKLQKMDYSRGNWSNTKRFIFWKPWQLFRTLWVKTEKRGTVDNLNHISGGLVFLIWYGVIKWNIKLSTVLVSVNIYPVCMQKVHLKHCHDSHL